MPGDTYYPAVRHLLHLDNPPDTLPAIVEARGKVVTQVGNARVSFAQSKYGGASAFFDGNGDYLTLPSSADFDFGTGDFTVEMFVYPLAYGGQLFGTTNGAATGYALNLGLNQDSMRLSSNLGGAWADNLTVSAGGGPALNTWTHLALVRSGATITLYKDGNSVATAASFAAFNFAASTIVVGRLNDGTVTQDYNGYIDELRVVTSAVYTANFTPPAAQYVIGPGGADPYFGNNVLSLHMNGTNGSTTFTDVMGATVTAVGNAQISTAQSRFGGSSALFDGSGDAVSVTDTGAFDLTGDFTIECWVRPVSANATYHIVGRRNTAGNGWELFTDTDGSFFLQCTSGSPSYCMSSAGTMVANQWQHLAVTKSGATMRVFHNGVLVGSSATTIGTLSNTPVTVGMRALVGQGAPFYDMNGYIDDVRITKGVGRYTGNFAVPTGPHHDVGSDPWFDNVALLMHMDGSSFTDVKGNAVTVRGGAALTAAQLKFGDKSAAFVNGSGLDIAHTAAQNPGANDYTVECWIRLASVTGNKQILFKYNANSGLTTSPYGIYRVGGDLLFYSSASGTTWDIVNGLSWGTLAINTWYHIAVTRQGNVHRLFRDGVLVNSVTASGTPVTSTLPVRLGYAAHDAVGDLDGWIDDVRITTGVARYTSDFRPPVTPHPDIGVDFNWAKVVLGLHCDGANGSTTFADVKGATVTANGNAQISTAQSKFGGSSLYHNGTNGSFLSIPNSTAFDFAAGDFTVECWLYYQGTGSAGASVIGRWGSGPSTNADWLLYIDGSGIPSFWANGAVRVTGVAVLSSTWAHVAVTRSGNTWRIFINGTQAASATVSLTVQYSAGQVLRTSRWDDTASFLTGHIDDLRITKGVARYTSAFTPPIAAFPTPSTYDPFFERVVLLLNGDGANNSTLIGDITGKAVTVVGNAQISTAQSKFGGSSLAFDGAGDYLTFASSTDFEFNADFTIELWYRPAQIGVATGLCEKRAASTIYGPGSFYVDASGYLGFVSSANGTDYGVALLASGAAMVVGTWYHLAVTRFGNVWTIWVDGVSRATTTVAQTPVTNANAFAVGATAANGDLATNGNIDDFRITKGVARYTAAFTPPLFAHPTGPEFGASDPTVALLKMDSTGLYAPTFPDVKGATVTASTGVTISAAQSVFGGAAAVFTGAGGLTLPAFDLPGDYTVEFRVRRTGTAGGAIVNLGSETWGRWQLYYDATTGRLRSDRWGYGDEFTPSYNLPIDTWVALRMTRIGGTAYLFVNGTLTYTFGQGYTLGNGNTLRLGLSLIGQMDEFRLTNGFGRSSANYTLDLAAFPEFAEPSNGSALDLSLIRWVGPTLATPAQFVGPHPVQPGLALGGVQLGGPFAGNGRIAGRVFTLVVPAPVRQVRLHDRRSGVQVAETKSDGGGYYEFVRLRTDREFFVTAFDDVAGYNAVIQDRVTAAPITYTYIAP